MPFVSNTAQCPVHAALYSIVPAEVAVRLSTCGNIVGLIDEVILRRAGLVLKWVTVHGYIPARYLTKEV